MQQHSLDWERTAYKTESFQLIEAKYWNSSLIIYYKGFMPDDASQTGGRQPIVFIVNFFLLKVKHHGLRLPIFMKIHTEEILNYLTFALI